LGFWETLNEIGRKVPEIANSLKELTKDEQFNEHLGKAGTIGSLCLIGLDIYSKIKNDLQTPEKRAFGSLLKIVFESTKDSLPESDKIELKQIKTEDLINELFDLFIQTGYEWDFDLPSHPVIDRYKKQVLYIVKTNHYDIDLSRFFIDFRIRIEDKAVTDENLKLIADENIKPFYRGTAVRKLSDDLREYLKHIESLKDEVNPLDGKSPMKYYVENKAVLVPKDMWYQEDKKISYDVEWNVEEDFLKRRDWWLIVIGAPFGIGKTSLVKHIAIDYASKHLEEPFGVYNYIPVFVSLKDELNNVFHRNDLDYVLDFIIAPEIGKKRKILLICDGLDEYDDIEGLLTKLKNRHRELTNMKVIITTRLNAGLPKTLELKEYVRLLPFDKDQVNDFFSISKYNIPDVTYQTLKKHGLQEEEIGKPLFCWMFAVIHPQLGIAFQGIEDRDIKRSLIYQEFIHSTIRGKHKESGIHDYNYTEYDIDKEKKIFRKIAALKMIYGNSLTENILIRDLAKFEDQLSAVNEEIRTVLAPIISSYFYSEGLSSDPKLDFIHESFKEYLLAEYYIESLLTNEPKPYRLNVGIPSHETIMFLDGLLKLISTDDIKNNKYSLMPYVDRFLKSLSASQEEQIEITNAKSILITNVLRSCEDENIVFHRENEREEKELWNTVAVHYTKYQELWMYRWISLFILSTLAPPNSNINKKKLSSLIRTPSHTTPYYLKRMSKLDLSSANLSYATLSYATLSYAMLIGANLSAADLTIANLSHANLSHAMLIGANLSAADLTNANLTNADLTNAKLFGADLTYANLTNANLSYANLSYAKLFGANLTAANLTDANVSRTILQDAPLPANDPTTDEKNNGIADKSTERPLKKITKYTFDGKPIINQEENEESL
jgi:uncharacterized protein YjbI with pentapeptide repeats